MKEAWKPMKFYESSYLISNNGRVYSLLNNKILNTSLMKKSGYCYIQVARNNKRKNLLIHRYVALTFLPNNHNKPCINHINGNKTDNRISNLEWCTHKENMIHALKNGYFIGFSGTEKGSKCPSSKLNEIQVLSIKERIKNGESIKKISKDYPVTESAISEIKAGRSWSHIHIPEDF